MLALFILAVPVSLDKLLDGGLGRIVSFCLKRREIPVSCARGDLWAAKETID